MRITESPLEDIGAHPGAKSALSMVANPNSMWTAIYHGLLRWATKGKAAEKVGKKLQVTIETHTMTILRRHHLRRIWCPDCAREVDLVGMKEVGLRAGMSQAALRDWAQTQGWLLSDDGDGTLLICLESLLKTTSAQGFGESKLESREEGQKG